MKLKSCIRQYKTNEGEIESAEKGNAGGDGHALHLRPYLASTWAGNKVGSRLLLAFTW
jgi:hypothetical protein